MTLPTLSIWLRARDRLADLVVAIPTGRRIVERVVFSRTKMFVVSYPKSGRTWFRFMLGTALVDHFHVEPTFPYDVLDPHRLTRVDRRVPAIRFTHDEPFRRTDRHLDRSHFAGKEVVFIARDPRDVLVSSYYHHRTRTKEIPDPTFTGTLSEFVHDEVLGIDSIIAYMNSWAAARDVPSRFLMVRYEDLTEKATGVLRDVMGFFGVTGVSDDVLERAAASGSFSKMQELEDLDALGTPSLRAADASDPSSRLVRSGRVGGYRSELDGDDRRYVDDAMRKLDPFFGYQVAR